MKIENVAEKDLPRPPSSPCTDWSRSFVQPLTAVWGSSYSILAVVHGCGPCHWVDIVGVLKQLVVAA